MVQIAGKYEVVESKNWAEHLAARGVPEERIKKTSNEKSLLEISQDGHKVTLKHTSESWNNTSVYHIDEEIEETFPDNKVVKSTTTLNGDVLTITTKRDGGSETSKRIYTFSDNGLELVMTSSKPEIPEAKRIYKRV